MDRAAAEEKVRRAAVSAEAARKRQASAAPLDAPSEMKRVKLEVEMTSSSSFLASFDWTSLPATMVTEFIVANLQALSDEALASLVQAYRQAGGSSSAPPIAAPTLASVSAPVPPSRFTAEPVVEGRSSEVTRLDTDIVKEEPVDPLAMNIDNDEMEYEPDKLNDEVYLLELRVSLALISHFVP